MSSPTPTIQPPLSNIVVAPSTQSWNGWLKAQLSGVPTPGWISPRSGMKGFRRKTGWDIKSGKGTAGATLTLKGAPPVRGSVILQLFTATDFTDWDNFVKAVLNIPTAAQQADGLSWYWPGHASIGLTVVVVEEFSAPEPMGRGMYHAELQLIEWAPPPPVSIVKTVAATSPDTPESLAPVKPVDPRITAAQAQLAAAQASKYDGGGGGSTF